jgi:hypothetical protein
MLYELISKETGSLSLCQRCRIAKVSPTAYCAWRQQGERHQDETGLLHHVQVTIEEFPGYGYCRVTKKLRRDGMLVIKKRIQGVMQRHYLE